MTLGCVCLSLELVFIFDIVCTKGYLIKDNAVYINGDMYDALELL